MNDGSRIGRVAHAGMWDGKAMAAGQRRRRLGPGAVALSVTMVLASLALVTMPGAWASGGSGRGSPDGQCAPCPSDPSICSTSPQCKGSGCNPTYVPVSITNVQVSVQPTSVNVSWSESPSAQSTTFYWGNTTSYAFSTGAGSWSVYLNYLEPSTTYDYEISAHEPAGSGCGTIYESNTHTGTWTTSVDNAQVIQGIVTDESSGATPTQTLIVEAWCLSWQTGSYVWSYTNSQGHYSFGISSLDCSQYGSGGAGSYVVIIGEANPGYWSGHWNETVVVWAPQVVNFELPDNYVSPYIPEVLDFSNAPAGYGSISYQATFSETVELTHDWSVSGGLVLKGEVSGSTSTSTTVASGSGPYSNAGTLDWGATYGVTTGMLLFNSIYRTWNVSSLTLLDPTTDGFASQFGASPPTDNLEPGELPSDAYYLLDSNGLKYQNKYTPPNGGYSGSVQTSTSVSTESGFSISLSISADLPGGPSVDFDAQTGWTQTTTTSSGSDLSWSIGGANAECYDVFGIGGNANSYPVTNADYIGIYMWAPVSGICSGG